MNYKTTETFEAVIYKTLNYPYVGAKRIDRPNGKTAVEFEFDVPNMKTVQDINRDYFNHVLDVDAYDHDEAIRFIRKELYSLKDRP